MCKVKGCSNEPEAILCKQHKGYLVDFQSNLSEFTARISTSEQMRNLAKQLTEQGMQTAVECFPELAKIDKPVLEQLSAFLSVSVVSAIVQERANLLARALEVADSLPKKESAGIREFVKSELSLLGDGEN